MGDRIEFSQHMQNVWESNEGSRVTRFQGKSGNVNKNEVEEWK